MKNTPAFPVSEIREKNGYALLKGQSGLTKREYIATAALQGLLSKHAAGLFPKDAAGYAVQFADALLAELERGPHEE